MASTTLSPTLPAARHISSLATVTIVGLAYFSLMIVALHFLRPDLDAISRPTSEYAVGSYSALMTSAFFSLAVASLALVIGLYQGLPTLTRSGVGLILLGAWAAGVLVAMTFPMDPEGVPQTLSGTIHQTTGPLAFLSLTAGMILVSSRFARSEMWRPWHRTALILAIVMLAAFVGTFLSFITGSGLLGLAQRIALITAVIWMLLTAARLRSIARQDVA